jgi:hypothetical protein
MWQSYFIPMMKGELVVKMPKEPPKVHIQAGEEVPYTDEEIAHRTATFKRKKTIWDTTQKVHIQLS